MVQRYCRLVAGSADPENIKKYRKKLKYWEDKRKKTLKEVEKFDEGGIINTKRAFAKIKVEEYTTYG